MPLPSVLLSVCLSFVSPFPCVPCVNLRLFFLLLFLLINSFTFVSAHWQTLVNVYVLSSGYTVPCPYVQTCSCLHTTMLLSPLFLRFSVLTSFWHHQRVLNCARMTMLRTYLSCPWQRGLPSPSVGGLFSSPEDHSSPTRPAMLVDLQFRRQFVLVHFCAPIGKCLLVIIRVYTTLPLRANLLLQLLLLPSHHDVALASACSRHSGIKGYSTALE